MMTAIPSLRFVSGLISFECVSAGGNFALAGTDKAALALLRIMNRMPAVLILKMQIRDILTPGKCIEACTFFGCFIVTVNLTLRFPLCCRLLQTDCSKRTVLWTTSRVLQWRFQFHSC